MTKYTWLTEHMLGAKLRGPGPHHSLERFQALVFTVTLELSKTGQMGRVAGRPALTMEPGARTGETGQGPSREAAWASSDRVSPAAGCGGGSGLADTLTAAPWVCRRVGGWLLPWAGDLCTSPHTPLTLAPGQAQPEPQPVLLPQPSGRPRHSSLLRGLTGWALGQLGPGCSGEMPRQQRALFELGPGSVLRVTLA